MLKLARHNFLFRYTTSMLTLFAEAIINNSQWTTIVLVTIALGAILVAGVIFLGAKLTNRNTSYVKILLATLGIIAVLLLGFGVIPTVISDNNQRNKQDQCAQEAGYESPADNNTNKATAESQSIYRDCLNRS